MIEPLLVPPGGGDRIALPTLGIEMTVLIPATATDGQLCLIEEATAPGMGPPLHIHRTQTEIFQFLDGEYELAVGDRRFRAPPGSTTIVPPGTPHAFRNVGKTTARQRFLLTPAGEGEAIFLALAEAIAAGRSSPPELAAIAARFGTEFVGPPLHD
ncbi:MAG: cupin domain-containing protein [Geminicoccaceae bacterium]